jgi:CRISPR-associated protein Cst1
MSEKNNVITLYPSNWLFNAGVVGLKILDELENINQITFIDGIAEIPSNYFDNILVDQRFFGSEKTLNAAIVGKSKLYPNYINSSRRQDKENLVLYLKSFKRMKPIKEKCNICNNNLGLTSDRKKVLNRVWNKTENDFDVFFSGIREFSNKYNGELGGASSLFPNGFWNLEHSTYVCPLCSVILIHQHLSTIKLHDYSEIFINAPSFKVMYELNKLVKETFGSGNKLEARTKRDILATSVIEYTNKIQTSLGIWTGMNIEIVTKKNDVIEFYSLPYNVIKLITDRKIASLLSDLGEYSIYNKILDENYGGLIDISQKLLKLSTKEQLSTNENNLRNGLLNNWRNQTHLNSTANKILKLYSLIEDKLRRN